jgi:hypothetical protein
MNGARIASIFEGGCARPTPLRGLAVIGVLMVAGNTHQTVALDIVRRPKATPVHALSAGLQNQHLATFDNYF